MHKLTLDNKINLTQSDTNKPLVDSRSNLSDNVASSSPSRTDTDMKKFSSKFFIALILVAVVAGIGTGFGSYQLLAKSGVSQNETETLPQVAGDVIKKGDVFGSSDDKTFKDNAEGYLEIGGFNGEGSHQLLRAGGDSQTVYLTSSVTDLDRFDGMIVKIYGETFKGQKVGWLMDVGRVEVVDPNGEPPSEK
jgi:hypothetical protein